jgi:glycosidase
LTFTVLALAACDITGGPNTTPTPAPSPTSAQADVTPTQIAGDGKVVAEKLFHDSRDPQYRSPVGAVPGGTGVVLRLRSQAGDLTAAEVRIWNSTTEIETMVPMSPSGQDLWQATVNTPPEGAALWYRFVAHDGSGKAYYNDDKDRDGGMGEGRSFESDTDYVITSYDPNFKTPDWLRDGVVYQIFPDRFANGDPANDKPAGTFIYGGQTVKRNWGDTPTGGDDFFGGDLRGVIEKLDYLQSLGVTAIYFNPIFMAPSNHRYDTTDFTQIEPSLGDLATFQELVTKAREHGIRLILDGVFNHSSSDSLYFDKFSRYPDEGAYEAQTSTYFDWFTFKEWPDKYTSWAGVNTLPVFQENAEVEDFLFKGQDSIARRWLKEGTGGWRLDAAEQKSHAYWRDFRVAAKEQNPDAVIIGEYWQNSAPWLTGDQWDGTMNYRFRDAVLGWLANPARNVEVMVKKLASIREDYPPQALAASMNLLGSHDTTRALTEAGGDKNMLRLMALMQFTWPGLPTVYYGDEAGMEGGKDPDDRRTYPWGGEDQSLIEFYKMLAQTRHATSALRTGEYIDLMYDNDLDVYGFARKDDSSLAVVALNRSGTDHEIELPMQGVAPDGTTFHDQMTTGAAYTVQGGKLKVKVGAKWGALLVRD